MQPKVMASYLYTLYPILIFYILYQSSTYLYLSHKTRVGFNIIIIDVAAIVARERHMPPASGPEHIHIESTLYLFSEPLKINLNFHRYSNSGGRTDRILYGGVP